MSDQYQAKCSNILKAMYEAHERLTSITRDGVNDVDDYTYVKSDTMIEKCRTVLHEVGLLVQRTSYLISGDRSKTISHFLVAHPESGEALSLCAEFPVFYSPDQDDDKAIAASLTTAWSYWLRDLLMLPRLDGVEMDARMRSAPRVPKWDFPVRRRRPSESDSFNGHPSQWETVRRLIEDRNLTLTDKWQARLERRLTGKMLGEIPAIIEAEINSMRRGDMRGGFRPRSKQRGNWQVYSN